VAWKAGGALLVLAAVVLAACGGTGDQAADQPRAGANGGVARSDSPAGYAVTVTRGGRVLAQLSIEDLEALEFVSVEADGDTERGPRLSAVLALAGVEDFEQATISGQAQGRIGTAEITLPDTEVSDSVIFAVSRRGTVKLVMPDRPRSQWVVDVTEIAIRP
jgi:hypothetical protein